MKRLVGCFKINQDRPTVCLTAVQEILTARRRNFAWTRPRRRKKETNGDLVRSRKPKKLMRNSFQRNSFQKCPKANLNHLALNIPFSMGENQLLWKRPFFNLCQPLTSRAQVRLSIYSTRGETGLWCFRSMGCQEDFETFKKALLLKKHIFDRKFSTETSPRNFEFVSTANLQLENC